MATTPILPTSKSFRSTPPTPVPSVNSFFSLRRQNDLRLSFQCELLAVGNKKAVARLKRFSVRFSLPFENVDRRKGNFVFFRICPVQVQLAAFEIFAARKATHPAARNGCKRSRVRMVFKRLEVDDVHRLFHMERAKFSVRAPAVIIVHAVGNVAALLYFADDAPRADGVNRSRLDEETIPFLYGNKVEKSSTVPSLTLARNSALSVSRLKPQ